MSCWITLAGKRCGQRQAAMDGTLQLLELLASSSTTAKELQTQLPETTMCLATEHAQTGNRSLSDPTSSHRS